MSIVEDIKPPKLGGGGPGGGPLANTSQGTRKAIMWVALIVLIVIGFTILGKGTGADAAQGARLAGPGAIVWSDPDAAVGIGGFFLIALIVGFLTSGGRGWRGIGFLARRPLTVLGVLTLLWAVMILPSLAREPTGGFATAEGASWFKGDKIVRHHGWAEASSAEIGCRRWKKKEVVTAHIAYRVRFDGEQQPVDLTPEGAASDSPRTAGAVAAWLDQIVPIDAAIRRQHAVTESQEKDADGVVGGIDLDCVDMVVQEAGGGEKGEAFRRLMQPSRAGREPS